MQGRGIAEGPEPAGEEGEARLSRGAPGCLHTLPFSSPFPSLPSRPAVPEDPLLELRPQLVQLQRREYLGPSCLPAGMWGAWRAATDSREWLQRAALFSGISCFSSLLIPFSQDR